MLIVLPGIQGLAALTSKVKSKERLKTRVQVRAITDLGEIFLRVIATWGPPGLIGVTGPLTDTTSATGITGEECIVGNVAIGDVVLEAEQPAASKADKTAIKVITANNFLILVLFISQFMFSTTLYNVMVDN